MQEYGGKALEYRDVIEGGRDHSQHHDAGSYQAGHQYSLMQNSYGCAQDVSDQQLATYCRVATGIYEANTSNSIYQTPRYSNSSAPSFSSPPNSPLIGLVFDPSTSKYIGPGNMGDRNMNNERRNQNSWSVTNQEPIGTGAKKKIVKSQDKRSSFSGPDTRYHQERYKDSSTETERQRKDRSLTAESTSSLDFFVEGERMVSELCNIQEPRNDGNNQKQSNKNGNQDDDKNKPMGSSDALLTALDKIVIHDQIPNQIVQLAIEACTDAENIAIAHHNRPCFKNIHSICAKTRSNVQKPDSAVANLHSQGIPWVIKNFIFSFVRILDGWKGVKELLSEKHETFSRIENKYYSPNIRECFVQWQAVTKEMLTHIYKTFKCLDHGFAMEQKTFTHNYYATNSAAPRHQNKFQQPKSHSGTPRPVNASPQPYNSVQPPWVQNQSKSSSQSYNDAPWPPRSGVPCKKYPVIPPPSSHSYYPLNDQTDLDNFQKAQFKCDPCGVRETKPRQSWTITNVPDFRALEGMCHADQRELYTQLKHKMDAELGKAQEQPLMTVSCDLLQRRDMELKAKMIPLSHVEKTLIPSMGTSADIRGCYLQKNNSCGDTKEEADFFAAWGQMVQKEPNDYLTHHAHNLQVSSNVVTLPNNISGPVQFIDPENDEFHEMAKVYMKPGSYKVPIKPADPFMQGMSPENVYENPVADDLTTLKMKVPFAPVTLAPQPKYNLDWPCLVSRRSDEVYRDDPKLLARPGMPCLNMRTTDSLDLLSSMTSDKAWEAAKQSAPKLMDFIHEGSKSDTARLYDALGLSNSEEITEELRQMKLSLEQSDSWPTTVPRNHYQPKEVPNLWDQQNSAKHDYLLPQSPEQSLFVEEQSRYIELESKEDFVQPEVEIDNVENKSDDPKENNKNQNYDQSGNYVREEAQKKKSKANVSGIWFHPKKRKPLSNSVIKKFEGILAHLSQLNEANFILHDMDMKVAPRFYEVVKFPMCLHDISTKLKNHTYTDQDHIIQDFRRIFNNVRQYIKNYPDPNMKKSINKISSEFDRMMNEEFQMKWESKQKVQDKDIRDKSDKKEDNVENNIANENKTTEDNSKKNDNKSTGEDKK